MLDRISRFSTLHYEKQKMQHTDEWNRERERERERERADPSQHMQCTSQTQRQQVRSGTSPNLDSEAKAMFPLPFATLPPFLAF